MSQSNQQCLITLKEKNLWILSLNMKSFLISGRTVPFSKVPFIPLEFHLKYISDKFKGAICTKQTESVVRGHSCVMNQ